MVHFFLQSFKEIHGNVNSHAHHGKCAKRLEKKTSLHESVQTDWHKIHLYMKVCKQTGTKSIFTRKCANRLAQNPSLHVQCASNKELAIKK